MLLVLYTFVFPRREGLKAKREGAYRKSHEEDQQDRKKYNIRTKEEKKWPIRI